MSNKKLDMSEYVKVLEAFIENHTDEIVKNGGSITEFNKLLKAVKSNKRWFMVKNKTVFITLLYLLISTSLTGCANNSILSANDTDETIASILNVSASELQELTNDEYNSTAISLLDKANDLAFKLDDEQEMRTELDSYLPKTKRILVYWKNSSNYSLMFGDTWYLEKHNGIEWERIGSETAFYAIGYPLSPDAVRKHVYQVTDYTDLLSEGLYRIVTPCFYEKDIPITSDENYYISAEFNVTSDESKIKRSELDYDNLDNSRDLTPYELEQKTSVRIYKDRCSFDTTVVIDGEKYEIGAGEGRWGVVDISLYEADSRKYLIYTYSRTADTTASHVAIFDLFSLENIFVSRAFNGFDLCIEEDLLDDTVFTVSSLEHWESSEDNGYSSAIIDKVGYLIYENDTFEFKEID